MHEWFWSWLLLTAILFAIGALTRDPLIASWGAGTAAAALLEYLRVDIQAQWVVFLVIPSAMIVTMQRVRLARAGRQPATEQTAEQDADVA